MEVITSGHVDVHEEILNPYGGVRSSVILFNVDGFKPFWELVLHDLVCKAHGVSSSSDPSCGMPDVRCRHGPITCVITRIAILG